MRALRKRHQSKMFEPIRTVLLRHCMTQPNPFPWFKTSTVIFRLAVMITFGVSFRLLRVPAGRS
jgi:hypothetical protein